jgi:hypothetical protein
VVPALRKLFGNIIGSNTMVVFMKQIRMKIVVIGRNPATTTGREKRIIFTEHRDNLVYLVRRLERIGINGQIARIHGGMDFREREQQIEFFRRKVQDRGALYMVCTDAAGEGLNMQFAWRLLNWDIPLESGRSTAHRHPPLQADAGVHQHRLAGKTRQDEYRRPYWKLERIHKELSNDKVFDVISRLFGGALASRSTWRRRSRPKGHRSLPNPGGDADGSRSSLEATSVACTVTVAM